MALHRILHRLSVGQKMLTFTGLFLVVIVFILAMASYVLEQQRALNTVSERVGTLSERVLYLDEVLTGSTRMAAVTGDTDWLDRYDSHAVRMDDALDELVALAPQDVAAAFEASTGAANDALLELEADAFRAIDQGDLDAAREIVFGSAYEARKTELDQGTETFLSGIEADVADRRDTLESLAYGTLAVGIGALALALLLAYGVARSITSPLAEAVAYTRRVADGDLTVDAGSAARDEVGQLLNGMGRMTRGLRETVQLISESAEQVASAAEELSVTAGRSSEGARQQSTEVSQVATAMNEMSSTVQEVARSTQEASDAASDASGRGDEARTALAASSTGMETLAGEVEQAAGVIHDLEQRAERIGQVLIVIRNISEQTNLLALNAAIEAARAGDHGRGFAVVADEVRKLASNTQQSIGEIEEIIEEFQAGTQSAVEVMNNGQESAGRNVGEARNAVAALDAIMAGVTHISDTSNQIATALEEQSSTAEEINRNITTIEQLASETSTAVDEAASASQDLSRLSVRLGEAVARFRL
ncbi:methyl-accepting chemotaxis protein [Aquisalimonas asiatica]|uniref:Methyl-accepting chemotaxis protein n=1 Tax=Aquisalimonas asiatica TaxID=406100 RepID=A0A1H8UN76_9GAMM|nr:methyl-accepting chemotaxis protein [Aquisalimonas asiatica]SEP04344.1 methyl-accepting chemotaxis protein [Aquisalimonas asiatica]